MRCFCNRFHVVTKGKPCGILITHGPAIGERNAPADEGDSEMGRRTILAILLACMTFFTGIPRGEAAGVLFETGRAGEKEATLMVYMTGSDLEAGSAAATKDLQEMAESGVDLSAANVVVYTGGSPKWHSDVPEDVNAILTLQKDGFQIVKTFEQMSMGEAGNLSRFLNYAYQNYPAKTYDLILWDHGNGPVIGYCLDKRYDNDTLTLPEMQKAFRDSPFSKDNKLGFIGFDACLMASAELICTLGDYGEYLIASQETEPNFGWNYAFLDGLGKLAPKELACSVADRYYAFCEAYYAEKPLFHGDVTMSVTDLSFADALKTDVCALFKKAVPDVMSRFSRIAVSRVNTRAFGRASTGSEYDLVDLRCLSDELADYYPEETAALSGLLDEMVVHTVANTEQSSGVSLYYPFYNKHYYSSAWKTAYREMNVFPEYINFLNRYEQMWLASDMQEMFDTVLNVEPGAEEGAFYLPLSEEQLEITAEARYYILRRIGEGLYAPVYVDMNVQKTDGGLLAQFGGSVICYETPFGIREIPATYLRNRIGTKMEYSLLGFILERPAADGGWSNDMQHCDLQLSVDTADGSVEVKGIYVWDSEQGVFASGKRQEVDLSEWTWMSFMELSSRYLTREENGRIVGFWDWPDRGTIVFDRVPIADDPQFTFTPMYDDGYEYCVMFELTDVQGNKTCSEPYPLAVPKAPPEPEPEPLFAEPVGNGTAELLVNGVRMRFRVQGSKLGQQKYYVDVTNENDFQIQVSFDGISAHSITSDESCWLFAIEPGETAIEEFTALNRIIWQSGKGDRIRLRASAKNNVTEGTLFSNLPIALADFDEVDQNAYIFPVLGASAKEQALYSGNGIEVTLVELGFIPQRYQADPESDDAELTAFFRVDNTTDRKVIVAIPAFEINGVHVSNARGAIMDTVELAPHMSCYLRRSVTKAEAQRLALKSTFYDENGQALEFADRYQPLIDAISSLSALVVIANDAHWCPIALESPTDGAPYTPEGKLLYEDDKWTVLQEPPEDGMHPDLLALWVTNRTDRTLCYYLYCGSKSLVYAEIGPNATQRIPLMLTAEQRETEFHIGSVRWLEEYNYQITYGSRTRSLEESGQFRILTAKEAMHP